MEELGTLEFSGHIDFNDLRLSLQENYNDLVHHLRDGVSDYVIEEGEVGIHMDETKAEELQELMGQLRWNLVILMCLIPDEAGNISNLTALEVFDLGDGIGI